MYRRIFRGPIFKTFNWAIIVLVACWTVAFFFVNIFGCGTHFEVSVSCIPLVLQSLIRLLKGKFSSEGSAGYSCINGLEWTLTMAASDLLLDLAVLAIPVGPVSCTRNAITARLRVTNVSDLSIKHENCEKGRPLDRLLRGHHVSI